MYQQQNMIKSGTDELTEFKQCENYTIAERYMGSPTPRSP